MSEQGGDNVIHLTPRTEGEVHNSANDTLLSLRTKDGHQVTVRVIDGFCNSNEISRLANEQPVLITMPVKIEGDSGVYESKEAVPMLFAHGYRDQNGEHVVMPNGISSEQITRAVVAYREKNSLPRLKLLISCDAKIEDPRWDQDVLGRQLGVIGFAGNTNMAHTEAATKSMVINAQQGVESPFSDINHPNRWLINPNLFVFRPQGNKIVIKP